MPNFNSPAQGTGPTENQIFQIRTVLGVDPANPYDTSTYVPQKDATFYYYALAKKAGGYDAFRVPLGTTLGAISRATGTLPIPADLADLTYA
jgi:hypothetical protein